MNTEIVTILIIAVVVVIATAIAFNLLTGGKSGGAEWKQKTRSQVTKLNAMINSGDMSQMRQALIDADKTLDFALKNSKLNGSTMGERLKSAKHKFDSQTYHQIWEAHKQRNQLVHELDHHLSPSDLSRYYSYLRKGIQQISE